MNPRIDIMVEGGEWPARGRLLEIAERAVKAAIEAGGLLCSPDSELSILCTDDSAMQVLNRQWRGKDAPTNVLSFPGCGVGVGDVAGPILGDIAMASETIHREAALEGKEFDHHLSHMIVHGLLHLFGYDHVDDGEAAEMERLERAALAKLGVDDPYAS